MAGRPKPGEFELIARHFAPLAAGHDLAFDLTDDAALLRPDPDRDIVLTADAVVAGVHFLPDDAPDLIAAKLLRVNLSDLAAMGARPRGYLLTAAWPDDTDEDWIAGFARGLAADQVEFDVVMLGGDTVATSGPLTLSLTAVGDVARGQALRRNGASPGDAVFVSGSIGDGALGLRALRGEIAGLTDDAVAYLTGRYHLPRPRLALGQALTGVASAALDVSDGLVADLGHICETSGVGAIIRTKDVPLSPAATEALDADAARLTLILTGGDDYELLFTLPSARRSQIATLADQLGLPLTEIGEIVPGHGVQALGHDGKPITIETGGYTHI